MSDRFVALRQHFVPLCIIALGTLIQVAIIFQPMTTLLVSILPDDAFYYFKIAQNVARGFGSTFDGIHQTNGYHPLWLIMLLGIFIPAENHGWSPEVSVRLALLLSVVINAGTAFLLYQWLRRYTNQVGILGISLAVWVFNPYVLYETINGLETALGLFFLMLTMTLLSRLSVESSNHAWIQFGLVAGCMMLARVDFVFYFIAFLLWSVVVYQFRSIFKKVLIAGCAASLLVVPWLMWNWFEFHMLLTSASEGNAYINRTLTYQSGVGFVYEIKHIIYHLYNYGSGVLVRTGAPLLFLLAVGFFLGTKLDTFSMRLRSVRTIPIEVAYMFGFALLFFADAGLRFTGRSWYFISFDILLPILCACILIRLTKQFPSYKYLLFSLCVLSLGFSYMIGWYRDLENQMPNQAVMYNATLWANQNLPGDSILAAFNAGIVGYFSKFPVINLDGLVNNSALAALEQKQLWNYLKEERVTHIVDGAYYFENRYRPFFGIDKPLSLMNELYNLPIAGDVKSKSVSVFEFQ